MGQRMNNPCLPRRALGQTGLEISPLGLGTVKFGRNQGVKYPRSFDLPSDAHLSDLLALAKDCGVNLLDTAPAYGTSEARLGQLLKGQRQDWVIAGKAGEEFEDGQSRFDFSPQAFETSLERSLKRLGTDYLDILLIHSDGQDMDILARDDLIETMLSFKKRGLVRAIGASTKTVEGGLKTLALMDVVMACYNPAYETERPVLDAAAACGKGVFLKKVFASGHLDQMQAQDPVQAAMDFIFDHPATGAAIIGTITPDHLRANVRACLQALPRQPAA